MKHTLSGKEQIVLVMMMLAIILLANTVKSKEKPSQQEIDCEQAVLLFADEGTDMYHEHMELCTKYDPDYLTPLIEEQEQ